MPTFGQDFLKGFTATDSLRDYTHASKVFTTNSWELKPRFKFLYHVVFTINFEQIPSLRETPIFQDQNVGNLSLLVKTIDLPKYTISNETLNQYNRKRLVQTKINYDPITVTFHDDGGDYARELWYQYYSYYYKDPNQTYLNQAPNSNTNIGQIQQKQNGFNYNSRDIYEQNRSGNVNDWGFIGESYLQGPATATGKPPFFKDIRIFGFDQHKYAQYVLVNPIITNFNHDKYDYSQGDGIMENTMTIAYEAVKYYNGGLGKPDRNVAWPVEGHYDNLRSPLSRAGSTATIFGQGGLLDTAEGILGDLETPSIAGIIGAAQKAGAAYNTWKGKDFRSVVASEALSLGKDTLKQFGPGATRQIINKADGWVFPTATANRELQRQANTGTPPI